MPRGTKGDDRRNFGHLVGRDTSDIWLYWFCPKCCLPKSLQGQDLEAERQLRQEMDPLTIRAMDATDPMVGSTLSNDALKLALEVIDSFYLTMDNDSDNKESTSSTTCSLLPSQPPLFEFLYSNIMNDDHTGYINEEDREPLEQILEQQLEILASEEHETQQHQQQTQSASTAEALYFLAELVKFWRTPFILDGYASRHILQLDNDKHRSPHFFRYFQLYVAAAERGHVRALTVVGRILYYAAEVIRPTQAAKAQQYGEYAVKAYKVAATQGLYFEAMKHLEYIYRIKYFSDTMAPEQHSVMQWTWCGRAIDKCLKPIDESELWQTETRKHWNTLNGTELEAPLQSGAIALLDAKWLVEFANRKNDGGASILPRRQDLPSEAFLSMDQIVGSTSKGHGIQIICLSYMWLHPNHPDPKGTTLQLLTSWLQSQLLVDLRGMHERDWYHAQNCPKLTDGFQTSIPRWGIFWDYASLFQHPDPANGVYRTPEEQALFQQGLKSLAPLFSHRNTYCYKITKFPADYPDNYNLPPDANVAEYNSRGWPLTESSLVSMTKPRSMTYDLSLEKFDWDSKSGEWHRPPPLAPTQLGELVLTASFTNRKDDQPLVTNLYRTEFLKRFGQLKHMEYAQMRWTDDEVEQLARVIGDGHAPELQILELCRNQVQEKGCRALAAALLGENRPKALKTIYLSDTSTDFSQPGARLLCHALVQVERLCFYREDFTPQTKPGLAGFQALADAAIKVPNIKLLQLELGENEVDDAGLAVLAPLIVTHLYEVNLHGNDIGNEGLKALAEAAQALDSPSPLMGMYLAANDRIRDPGTLELCKLLERAPDMVTLELDEDAAKLDRTREKVEAIASKGCLIVDYK